MKKALVVGGSNGIGLAITKKLIDRGYRVDILDRHEPDEGVLPKDAYNHHYCDLLDLDQELISSFAANSDINFLMITAGFGRVADFEYFLDDFDFIVIFRDSESIILIPCIFCNMC